MSFFLRVLIIVIKHAMRYRPEIELPIIPLTMSTPPSCFKYRLQTFDSSSYLDQLAFNNLFKVKKRDWNCKI